MYRLFYDGEQPPTLPPLPLRKTKEANAWGAKGKDAAFLRKLRQLLSKTDERDRKLVLLLAQKVGNR